MPIIDSQVHAYERDHPGRPWIGTLAGPPEVTGDDMVAAMDEVGVDGALLVSPYSMYRFDASYALEVHRAHPGRFGLVKPVDPADPAVAEEIGEWAGLDGTVGVRIMLARPGGGGGEEGLHPGTGTVLRAAARHGLPVNLLCWGLLDQAASLARAHPDAAVVIDHLGLPQPFEPPAPPDPFAALSDVLALAELDNVAIKISGACTLSHAPFPYDDIWDPLCRIFDAFGLARCLWGTDWTRASNILTYRQGVEPFRLTDRLDDADRAMLMGGALAAIYGWAPGA